MTETTNEELESLTTRELQERYAQVHGITTTSRSRPYLMRQIRIGMLESQQPTATPAAPVEPSAPEPAPTVDSVQAAPLPEATNVAASAAETTTASTATNSAEPQRRTRRQTVSPGTRDPRLPAPGTVITREFGGRTHQVIIGEEDFEYEGKRWTSLSALAKHIAGTTWNGLLFFKLIPYVRRTKVAA